jgi:MFS transporter, SP family, general alpha glucoside:H+ symporter
MVITVVNGLGSWPASFAVAGETSSLLLRAKTQGLNWFTNSLFSGSLSIVLPYIFNPDAGNLGARTGFVFFGSCLAGLVVGWLIIPDMRGRDHAEIQRMFDLKVPALSFGNWTESEDIQELRRI